jgi:hypothetical protein
VGLGLGNSTTNSSALAYWTPRNISSLVHWYKHGTGITTALDDAGLYSVVKWGDQKGSNDAEASGVAVESPAYASGAVRFNHSGDVLTFDEALELGEFSIYFRVESNDLTGDILVGGDNNHFFKIDEEDEIRLKIGTGNRTDWIVSSPGTDTPFTVGVERDSDGLIVCYLGGARVDVDSGGEVGISTTLDLTHMGDPAVTVTVYEVLIFNEELSTLDRSDLHTYLSSI